LFVDGWKVGVVTNSDTGICYQTESYGGMEKMQVKQEQTYLGDVISSDGRHQKCTS
jgi:hypothetical protein